MKVSKSFFIIIAVLFLVSCKIEPKAIEFGTDNCDYCQMIISDNRFGAELVTKKGRVYKFDDLHCIKGFIKDNIVPQENIHSLWVVDFLQSEKLINLEEGFLLHNDELPSPMGADIIVFENKNSLDNYLKTNSGTALKWQNYLSEK